MANQFSLKNNLEDVLRGVFRALSKWHLSDRFLGGLNPPSSALDAACTCVLDLMVAVACAELLALLGHRVLAPAVVEAVGM